MIVLACNRRVQDDRKSILSAFSVIMHYDLPVSLRVCMRH